MKKYISPFSFLLFLVLSTCLSNVEAAYIFKNGSIIDVKDAATLPLQEHYNLGIEALKQKKWPEAVHQFRIVTINFPDADLAIEALYYLGVSYYNTKDVDLANKNFTKYLEVHKSPKHFESVFRYKLAIADAFKAGAKKHLFNQEKLPQWFESKEEAIRIYDEIISSLPNHDLAAKALCSKADLHRLESDFKASIQDHQAIIKKFPKTEQALQSYVKIAEVALEECQVEFQNPDILALAQINLKKLMQDFPRAATQIQTAQSCIAAMNEVYAKGLYETGQLYERKKEPKASVLYYHQAITEFPETKVASDAKARMKVLESYAEELHIQ